MGFFDKAKNFLTGYGLKVEITSLERQDPKNVRFPVTDTVFKGNYKVTAEKDCTVLTHTTELILEKTDNEGAKEEVVLAKEVHDEKTEIIGLDLKWPYSLKAGQSVEDGFCMTDIDIPAQLKAWGINPSGVSTNASVKLYFKVCPDVKGSPFDPTAKTEVFLTE